jgi:hypothetical protein
MKEDIVAGWWHKNCNQQEKGKWMIILMWMCYWDRWN